ncbi:MAG TPA: transglutaminase domain-containing protein [Candidatus Didemnitutus sp.]|nr:transglutaminase domain-containing protein [Candidatus Didemnitutus sp.]
MTRQLFGIALGFAGLVSIGAASTFDIPDWLAAISHAPTPDGVGLAPAVVLLDDTTFDVDAHGVANETHRVVIRILRLSARDQASGVTFYNGAADKVQSTDAWLLRDGKVVKPVKSDQWVDLAANSPGAAVDEIRSRSINLSDLALGGDVFACEFHVRRPLVVGQLGPFLFGGRDPSVTERLTLHVPAGFNPTAGIFGAHPPLASHPDPLTWSWTSYDRPYRPEEPMQAPGSDRDAELLLDLGAPGNPHELALRSFARWSDVATVTEELNQSQCDSSAALSAKVRELTAGCADNLSRIKAVGDYVQKIRYIEINKGLRYGLGWQARKASTVFSTGYGDCKDKANLLMAMLGEAGIKSHRVIALAGDEEGREVHPEFPSPIQFNHAVLGIEVDDSIQAPAVLTVPSVGRILIFDPTDPFTPVGDLPGYIQGTRAFLSAPGNNELFALPDLPARDDYCLERRFEVQVSPAGDMLMTGVVSARGQQAARLRHEIQEADTPERVEKLFAAQLADSFRGAIVRERKTSEDPKLATCALSFTCANPRYSQPMSDGSTIVKLDVLSRRYLPNLPEPTRQLPVQLRPIFLHDQVKLVIDPAHALDEVPAKVALNTPFGTYEVTYALVEGNLVVDRTIAIAKQQVAVADYARLRKFLSDVARADRNSVLLHKKA